MPRPSQVATLSAGVALLASLSPSPARADDDTALARYRKIWNSRRGPSS